MKIPQVFLVQVLLAGENFTLFTTFFKRCNENGGYSYPPSVKINSIDFFYSISVDLWLIIHHPQ